MKGRTAVLGASVTMLSYVVSRAINLSVTVVLARALGPTSMGVFAFALLAVEIFDTVRDFGLRETLVYDRTEDPGLRATAFTMILGIGALQAAALLIFAQYANVFVDDPVIAPVLMWLALLFPINALGSVPDALLQRAFRFTPLALAEVLAVITKAAVAFIMIYLDQGIWSVVVGMLCGTSVRVAVVWMSSDWRPVGSAPNWQKARELLRYGRHIVLSGIVNAIQLRVDQMAIVSMLGDTALGLYYVAARIPEIAILGVNSVITRVVFPAFSDLASAPERLRFAYRTTVAASMAVISPLALGLAATSPLVVQVVFGGEWAAATPVLVFLSLSGIPNTIGWSSGDIFKATGKPQYLWILMVVETVAAIPLIVSAAKITGDITWVAAMMFAAACLAAAIRLVALAKVSDIPASVTLYASVRPMVSALIMAAVVYLAISENPLGLVPGALLAGSILLGAVVYVAMQAVIDRKNVVYWYRSVLLKED